MPQETNFNVSPYFDDFDPSNDYYRVLFKPGYPIQARELTTIQSILQNQIESLGRSRFKDGQVVIPGQLSYDNPVYALEIDENFNGLPVSLYFENLLGAELRGSQSGVVANVVALLKNTDSERGNYTLYLRYIASGGENFTNKKFEDGEIIITNTTITYGGRFTIQEGQGVCSAIFTNSTSEGSLVNVAQGVYFVRGILAEVKPQTLILDQYGVEPSYRVGFDVKETIVTTDDDESLFDNARSFSNYTAPGADRFKLELILTKKSLETNDIDNFVELIRIENGEARFIDLSETGKEKLAVKNQIARRTADQTGDYIQKDFDVIARDSLNDRVLESGLYFDDQTTITGDAPSESNFIFQIGPGKAYISGYEVETTTPTLLECKKPRTTGSIIGEVLEYDAGIQFLVDNTFGSPGIGFTNNIVSLEDRRLAAGQVSQGNVIGQARVYDYIPVTDYEDDTSKFFIRLYDIDTYNKLSFTSPIPLLRPSFIKGTKSSASGYVLDSSYPENRNISTITFPSLSISSIVFDDVTTGIASVTTSTDHDLVEGEFVYIDNTGVSKIDYATNGNSTWQVVLPDLTVESIILDLDSQTSGVATVTTVQPHLLSTLDFVGFNGTSNSVVNAFSGQVTVTSSDVFEVTIGGLVDFNTIFGGTVTDGTNPRTYLDTDEFQIQSTPNAFDGIADVIGSGTVVTSDEEAVITTSTNISGAFSAGDEIFIQSTSSQQFNSKFTVDSVGVSTLTLNDVTATNFYSGTTSATGGKIIAGIETVTLYSVSGEFTPNEKFEINGISNNRLIRSIEDYSLENVKAISGTNYTSDVVLDNRSALGKPGSDFTITAEVAGESIVTAGLQNNFIGVVKTGDIITYPNPVLGDPIYNEVVAVSAGGTSFRVRAVETIEGICSGDLPSSNYVVPNVSKIKSISEEEEPSFLAKLDKDVVESISFEDNEILQRRLFDNVSFSQNTLQISIDANDSDIRFATFDEDRYVVTFSDGSKEPLRFDKVQLSGGNKIATFYDLSQASGTADVIVTVTNNKPNSKVKILNRANSLVVNYSALPYSGIGATTRNDGLTYLNVYGLRVQDEEISLNVPDALRVLAVYESFDNNEAKIPTIQGQNFNGPSNNNQDLIIGEKIKGKTTGAVGLVVKKTDTDKVEYVYLNSIQFEPNEVVISNESSISFTISSLIKESKNITQNFDFDDGQTESFYDYSRIIRKKSVDPPEKQLKIIFQNYTIDSSDTGEFVSVNSYSQVSYKHDIPLFDGERLTDFIDFRPRVANYTLNLNRSPFEWGSRSLVNPGQYSEYNLAPGENFALSYNFYLPRIDKVILLSDGTFQCVHGIPSEDPVEPEDKAGSLDIATVYYPAYVFNIESVTIDISEHKGYQMNDIQNLEERIEKLEKFTNLAYLENKVENLSLRDVQTGLERFKCGYFTDDFSTNEFHDVDNPSYRCSIDPVGKTLRPSHYTTSLDLEVGSEAISGVTNTFDSTVDKSFVSDLGNPGIKKTGDLVTLDYSEELYLEQQLATKFESVTPFLVKYWEGIVTIKPSELKWPAETVTLNRERTLRVELPARPDLNIVRVTNTTRNRTVRRRRRIVRVGRAPFFWLSTRRGPIRRLRRAGINVRFRNRNGRWRARAARAGRRAPVQLSLRRNQFGVRQRRLINRVLPRDVARGFITEIQRRRRGRARIRFNPNVWGRADIRTVRRSTTVRTTTQTTSFVEPRRISITQDPDTQTTRQFDQPVEFLRQENVFFSASRLKPLTRIYPYLESIRIDRFVTPKLIEIEMVPGTGTFVAGETIRAKVSTVSGDIVVRLCTPDHLEGPFNNPSKKFTLIPYTQTAPPSSYTATSTYLNLDCLALSSPVETQFFGSVTTNMVLVGETSGAECTVKEPRLISDRTGNLIGSFYIPDSDDTSNPRWTNGENSLLLTDVPSLAENAETDESETTATAEIRSADSVPVTETTIISTRRITITPPRNVNITTITNNRVNTTTVTNTRVRRRRNPRPRPRRRNRDPLAQTFFVEETEGIFLTSVEVYFRNKPEKLPVTCQIRTVTNGYPTNVTVPFAEKTLSPEEVNVSVDGSVSTRFTFPSPVYLQGVPERNIREAPIGSTQLAEYCIVLLSDDPTYEVFISELGKVDIATGNRIASQPTLGSLFKSQNGTTWTPSQLEDLKYKIYRADFVEEGLVRFFNPELGLGNRQVSVLGPNQLSTLSKRALLKVSGSSSFPSDFGTGSTIIQTASNRNVTAKVIDFAGDIRVGSSASITNAGIGYTNGTFEDVPLTTRTGSGSGAVADITVSGNVITSVVITNGGFGYVSGDVLDIPNIGQNVGFGGQVSVSQIETINSLLVENINKTYSVTISDKLIPLSYVNSSGITTFISATTKLDTVQYDNFYDGLHFKVDSLNHGNHSSSNYVRISEIIPDDDGNVTELSEELTQTEVSTMSVSDTTGFELFEGRRVSSPSNIGYVIINDEIVGYTTFTSNTIGGLTRGVDGSLIQRHDSSSEVRKYEFRGISLRRINIDHDLSIVSQNIHKTTLNSFYVKINPIENGTVRSNDLFFNSSGSTGVEGTVVSNNIQFEALTPDFSIISPPETSISAKVRTTSATSINGNEISFNDQGYIDISLDEVTFFNTPRMIASKVNEERRITDTIGNKSLTMEFVMKSENSLLSPVIDLESSAVTLTSNLINAPSGIGRNSSYADDDFVRSLNEDKHDAIYISKPINLKLPANSLKVILNANLSDKSDVRVLYQLLRDDLQESGMNYELFPGFVNLKEDSDGIKRVVDASKNDGSSDTEVKITAEESFKEYEYTIDNLPEFNGFSIKIVLASENQANPPTVRDVKAIATIKPEL